MNDADQSMNNAGGEVDTADAHRTAGGQTVQEPARGVGSAVLRWATRADPAREPDGSRWWRAGRAAMDRRLTAATTIAGIVSVLLVVTSIASIVAASGSTASTQPAPSPTPSGPGDPVLAAMLADQADRLNRGDPLAELRLRLAAHTVDPGNSAYRAALAELLLGPRPLANSTTTIGPITSLAFGGGQLAVGGAGGVQVAAADTPAALAFTPSPAADLTDVTVVGYTESGQLVVAGDGGIHTITAAGPSTQSEPMSVTDPAQVYGLARLAGRGWAATTRDGRLVIWSSPTMDERPRVIADGLGDAVPLAATPDGRFVFVAVAGGVGVWDAAGGRQVTTINVGGQVTALAAGGRELLLVGRGDAATLWDIRDPSAARMIATLAREGSEATSVAVAADGRTAVTAGAGSAVVWELPDSGQPQPIALLPLGDSRPTAVAYNADATLIATGAGNTVQLWSVAELLVFRPAQVQPAVLLRDRLDVPEPITYAATNSDGSYLLTSGTELSAYLWQTRDLGVEQPVVSLVDTFEGPVAGAAAAGRLLQSTLVTVAKDATASAWVILTPRTTFGGDQIADAVDTVAVAPDGKTAVIAHKASATVWSVGDLHPEARAALTYHQPTTALAFAPRGMALVAGHADGSVTMHDIATSVESATRRRLTGGTGPVNAVALSPDATAALAVSDDGTITVWHLPDPAADPAARIPSAVAVGAHHVWLSETGEFAIVASAAGPASLWSLVDPQRPARLGALPAVTNPAVPTIVTANGHNAVEVGRDGDLVLWDLQPVLGVVDDPTTRACALAHIDHEQWQAIVPNPAFANPCLPPPLPTIDSEWAPTPTATAD